MPVVPMTAPSSSGTSPLASGPQPSPTDLMMAAASMDSMGKFSQSQPKPRRPKSKPVKV